MIVQMSLLTVVNNIPTWYRRELFDCIEAALPATWQMRVVYLAESEGVRVESLPLARGYEHRLPVLYQSRDRSSTTSDYILNRGCLNEAIAADAMLFLGYSYPSYLVMASVAKFRRVPTAVFVESILRSGSSTRPIGLRRQIKKVLVRNLFDQVIVPGARQREYVAAELGVPEHRISMAVNGLTPLNTVPRRAEARGRLLFVGRIAPEKNLELLLQAVKELPVTLTIAGTGESSYEARCRQAASSAVTWLGYQTRNQLEELYASHDALVLPSTDETWGFVVNEAIRAGMPVVLSSQVGCASTLLDGNGASFDPGRKEELVTAIHYVLPRLQEMSWKSLHIAATYTASAQALKIIEAMGLAST